MSSTAEEELSVQPSAKPLINKVGLTGGTEGGIDVAARKGI